MKKTSLSSLLVCFICSLGRPHEVSSSACMRWKRPLWMLSRSSFPIFSQDAFWTGWCRMCEKITYLLASLLISVLGYVSKWSLCPQVFVLYDAFHIVGHSIFLDIFFHILPDNSLLIFSWSHWILLFSFLADFFSLTSDPRVQSFYLGSLCLISSILPHPHHLFPFLIMLCFLSL